MVFSTLTFLFFFLPAVVISYYLFRNRIYRNTVLLLFSLLFYGWGEPQYILLMFITAFVAYGGGCLIHNFNAQNKLRSKKIVMVATTILIILNLVIFKYYNFIAVNVNTVFPKLLKIYNLALPIGISFYTFQILSYVIDLYWGKISVQKNFFNLLLYVTFFPQLIAGPIVRYQTVESEIHFRKESMDDVTNGLRRFIFGLAKKVIIANNVGLVSSTIYSGDPAQFGTLMYWIAAIAYALQIYFDFSGYSDMAIGLGSVFGFHFLENFNYPYIATSITDFWRRWHISLSSWFRDYVYIPLGGNRVKKSRWLLNICLVWGLTGLWHGADWNFILWGVYYALWLIAEKTFLFKVTNKLPPFIQWLYTSVVVIVGWVIFNISDMEQMTLVLHKMFVFQPTNLVESVIAGSSIIYGLFYLPLGIICIFPWRKNNTASSFVLSEIVTNLACLMILAICVCYTFGSNYNPFIYFRF